MKKIISLFARNYDGDRLVRDEIVPGAEWVSVGEGTATRKFDGACCMVSNGKLFKRYDLPLLIDWLRKKEVGYKGPWDPDMYKPSPKSWQPAEETPDSQTGHWPGWLPIGEGPEDKWFRKAFEGWPDAPDGTYEACGPHFQGNPEGFASDQLIAHGLPQAHWVQDAPRTFVALRMYLSALPYEGIVWHHPDGRMVKIKARDFGLKRIDWKEFGKR